MRRIRKVIIHTVLLGACIFFSACEIRRVGINDGATQLDSPEDEGIIQIELVSREKYVDGLRRAVTNYNLMQKNVKVNLTIVTDDASWTRTMADVMSGKGPDLFLLPKTEAEYLYENEALLPVESCLSEETKSALINGALEYGTIDGKLVGVLPYVDNVDSFLARKDELSAEDFTLDHVMELKRANQGVKRVLTMQLRPMEAYNEYYYLLGTDIQNSKFLDWEKGISAFAANGFQDVLEFLKEESETNVGGEALWEAGEILAMYSPAGMTSFFFSGFEKLQGNARQVGVPTETGGKFCFRPVGMLVINQSSGHQKEISEFLEALLSVQNQTRDLLVMSVRKDAAEYGIVRQEKHKPDGTEDGEQWMWQQGNTYTRIDFDGTKEELCEAYASFVQSMVAADSSGKEVSDIVWQEIETYLEGKKSAQATVETIDRRVQLYFDER